MPSRQLSHGRIIKLGLALKVGVYSNLMRYFTSQLAQNRKRGKVDASGAYQIRIRQYHTTSVSTHTPLITQTYNVRDIRPKPPSKLPSSHHLLTMKNSCIHPVQSRQPALTRFRFLFLFSSQFSNTRTMVWHYPDRRPA